MTQDEIPSLKALAQFYTHSKLRRVFNLQTNLNPSKQTSYNASAYHAVLVYRGGGAGGCPAGGGGGGGKLEFGGGGGGEFENCWPAADESSEIWPDTGTRSPSEYIHCT